MRGCSHRPFFGTSFLSFRSELCLNIYLFWSSWSTLVRMGSRAEKTFPAWVLREAKVCLQHERPLGVGRRVERGVLNWSAHLGLLDNPVQVSVFIFAVWCFPVTCEAQLLLGGSLRWNFTLFRERNLPQAPGDVASYVLLIPPFYLGLADLLMHQYVFPSWNVTNQEGFAEVILRSSFTVRKNKFPFFYGPEFSLYSFLLREPGPQFAVSILSC